MEGLGSICTSPSILCNQLRGYFLQCNHLKSAKYCDCQSSSSVVLELKVAQVIVNCTILLYSNCWKRQHEGGGCPATDLIPAKSANAALPRCFHRASKQPGSNLEFRFFWSQKLAELAVNKSVWQTKGHSSNVAMLQWRRHRLRD